MSLQDDLRAKARELWRQTVKEVINGGDEMKTQYADKILALLEEGGTDEVVLREVAVQIPLVAQAMALHLTDVAEGILKEAARWARVLLSGLIPGGVA